MLRTTTGNKSQRSSHSLLLALMTVLVFVIVATVANSATPEDGGGVVGTTQGQATTLLLVRDWNPESGILIGWLPNHGIEMDLQMINKPKGVTFNVDEPLVIHWLRRRAQSQETGRMQVSPAPRTFEGSSWLPLDRDANVVRVGKDHFLIRSIVFGSSKWRDSSKPVSLQKVDNDAGPN
jgi:hypothetical protein